MECTVYAPCGRYVVHCRANEQERRLWLDVRSHAPSPAVSSSPTPARATAAKAGSTGAPSILWGASRTPSPAAPPPPLHLAASLNDSDVVALTTSAGVRKTFATFSNMLYDALIGRSPCVRFYVETVAEMKERIQGDVLQRQKQQQSQPASQASPRSASGKAAPVSVTTISASSSNSISGTVERAMTVLVHDSISTSGSTKVVTQQQSDSQSQHRVRAAVGDTVIELDEDIAADVLEQRFLTVDYDVDFTRAIFPIPLLEPVTKKALAEKEEPPQREVSVAASPSPSPSPRAPCRAIEGPSSPPVTDMAEQQLRHELQAAQERLTRVEAENAKLRKENAALVQLSKQKMHEMQRLCDDFQQRVQGAADAEKLRSTNTELRLRLEEALESRQAVLRTLERERSQHQQRQPELHRERLASASRTGSLHRSPAQRSLSSRRSDNPYLRSLSRDSDRGTGAQARTSSRDRLSYDGTAARVDRNGEPILSPTPSPAARRRTLPSSLAHRRISTRFDTPPGPGAASSAGRSRRQRSHSYDSDSSQRRQAAGSEHSACGGGDSPAPRDRTGGRQAAVQKPLRSSSGGGGRGTSSSLPRRGASLWADTSDSRPRSPCGSVASSRCSSASHERLYRAATASSRQHQTPKALALEELGARRTVFR